MTDLLQILTVVSFIISIIAFYAGDIEECMICGAVAIICGLIAWFI